jgi:hypothetical protein
MPMPIPSFVTRDFDYVAIPVWRGDMGYRKELARFLKGVGYDIFGNSIDRWVEATRNSDDWCVRSRVRGAHHLFHSSLPRADRIINHYYGLLVIPGCFQFLSVKEKL